MLFAGSNGASAATKEFNRCNTNSDCASSLVCSNWPNDLAPTICQAPRTFLAGSESALVGNWKNGFDLDLASDGTFVVSNYSDREHRMCPRGRITGTWSASDRQIVLTGVLLFQCPQTIAEPISNAREYQITTGLYGSQYGSQAGLPYTEVLFKSTHQSDRLLNAFYLKQ